MHEIKKMGEFYIIIGKRMFSGLLGKRINESLINTPRSNELIRSYEILINLAGKLLVWSKWEVVSKIVGECHFLVGDSRSIGMDQFFFLPVEGVGKVWSEALDHFFLPKLGQHICFYGIEKWNKNKQTNKTKWYFVVFT